MCIRDRFVVYISFHLQTLNRKIAYCCIRWCSLVLLASSVVYALIPTIYLAVRGIHIFSSSKIKPENRVLLYTSMFARAFGIFFCVCLISYHIPGSSYLAVRGIHRISSSQIKPENRVLLYTYMFARAFGIFCRLHLVSYHIPDSLWYTYHFISKN